MSYAWATLVMRNELYACGALVLGASLRRAGTRADLVCMVTDDISDDVSEALGEVWDHVVEVPKVEAVRGALQRQQRRFGHMYNPWLRCCLTKFTTLSMAQYDKVAFLDADMLCILQPPTRSLASQTPAASSLRQEGLPEEAKGPSVQQGRREGGDGGAEALQQPEGGRGAASASSQHSRSNGGCAPEAGPSLRSEPTDSASLSDRARASGTPESEHLEGRETQGRAHGGEARERGTEVLEGPAPVPDLPQQQQLQQQAGAEGGGGGKWRRRGATERGAHGQGSEDPRAKRREEEAAEARDGVDAVFRVPAPAGILDLYRKDPDRNAELHGRAIPEAEVRRALRSQCYAMRGCILVLAPDPGLFLEILESAEREPIGQCDAMAGPDEYFITQFYLDRRIPWHHLHYRYGMISWVVSQHPPEALGLPPVFLHYVSEKPWAAPGAPDSPSAEVTQNWEDFQHWDDVAASLVLPTLPAELADRLFAGWRLRSALPQVPSATKQ